MEKKELRRQIRQKMKGLSPEYRKAASESIASQVIASEEFRQARTLLLYLSMAGEPDTAPILQAAWSAGKKVCVPRCLADYQMDAVVIASLAELTPHAYGILEPEDSRNALDPWDLDLILVPCLSASGDGRRLGHGAGYYDRFLEKTHAKTMCLCFGELLSEEIPMEPTDKKMDCVITE